MALQGQLTQQLAAFEASQADKAVLGERMAALQVSCAVGSRRCTLSARFGKSSLQILSSTLQQYQLS